MKIKYKCRSTLIGCKAKIDYKHPDFEDYLAEKDYSLDKHLGDWPPDGRVTIIAMDKEDVTIEDSSGNDDILLKFLIILESPTPKELKASKVTRQRK